MAEKATKDDVKALALYYNALALDGKAGRNEGRATDEIITKERLEAAELMEKAVKLAPDAKVGDETLAKAAAVEMVSLKIGVGRPVPDVEGTDLDGKKVKLSSYRGKVVLLDFWATWCGPCMAMIPHDRELVEKLKDKPFALSERQRRRREGGPDRVHQHRQDAVGPLVGRPEGAGLQDVPGAVLSRRCS